LHVLKYFYDNKSDIIGLTGSFDIYYDDKIHDFGFENKT
jgi:hypothetical protein